MNTTTIYISIKAPKEINSKRIYSEIEAKMKEGFKTYQLLLICEFITGGNGHFLLLDKFRMIKNQIALKLDTRLF